MTRKQLKVELTHIAILVVIGFTMTWLGLTCRSCDDSLRKLVVVGSFTSLLWILLWKGNEYLGHAISRRISWVKFPLRRFIIGTLATIAYTFLAMYGLTALYERSFAITMGSGVLISVVITIGISLFMHAREFFLNWRQTAIRAQQYEKETMQARYESLKNQVNPHFLFNSLNALSNLVYEDEDKAVTFIRQLSLVYQYVLDTQEREVVSLKEELAFLDSYLYLQQIRFGGKLRVKLPGEHVEAGVAPLALQMLFENAIKHNVISEDDPLSIRVWREEAFLVVENNLQKRLSGVEESSGVGLENIRRRYEMLGASPVQVSEDQRFFRVKLPLLNLQHDSIDH